MRIAFIHEGRAMLPEIGAYTRFFESKGHETCVCIGNSGPDFCPEVEWHFMGINGQRRFENTILIHEYASASVPPFASLKNKLKHWRNATPDFRIYLNDWVMKQLAFDDAIPFGFRDMGVWIHEYQPSSNEKRYDFIYPGSMHPYWYFRKLLTQFSTGKMKDRSILVLSKLSEVRRQQWRAHSNIVFQDPVPADQLPAQLQLARYGLNCRPQGSPYNFQTSSKLLEYVAAKLPVVTTDSPWLSTFTKQRGGTFFKLSPDFSNFHPDAVANFDYKFPDIMEYDWEKVISGSGVVEYLTARLV